MTDPGPTGGGGAGVRRDAGAGGESDADPLAVQRKRLRFRSWHRGAKEMDLILGRFADRYLDELTAEDLDRYELLLVSGDPELYAWITRAAPVPETHDHAVMRLLQNFNVATQED